MSAAAIPAQGRLGSVDAMRGITVAAMLLVNDPGSWAHVYPPLEHAPWHGLTPTDLVFPFFLFIMGAAISLAVLPRLERGQAPATVRSAALWRALRILALGIAINLLAAWFLPDRDLRWPGVLQRIAVCFAAAALLAIHTPPRVWIMVIVGALVGYALLLWAGGTLAIYANLPDRIDTMPFGHAVWDFDAASGRGHDPEGLASSVPALATTLLGLQAGVWLRGGRRGRLLAAALLLMAGGWLWSLALPFNKNLWTPSFVLLTAGLGTLLLLALHEAIDRHGWPALGQRFGRNAITAYAGSSLLQVLLPAFGWKVALYGPLAGSITPLAGPRAASLAWAILFVALWWVIVWVLDRRQWHLKI